MFLWYIGGLSQDSSIKIEIDQVSMGQSLSVLIPGMFISVAQCQ